MPPERHPGQDEISVADQSKIARTTPTEPSSEELASAFANVSAALSSVANENELFARIASLAVLTIESCDLAGVMRGDHGEVSTTAASSPRVCDLDRLQIDAGEGPCLDVLAGEGSRYGSDFLFENHQWQRFSRLAVDAGIRSASARHPHGTRAHHQRPGL
jgi:hypothetical protein